MSTTHLLNDGRALGQGLETGTRNDRFALSRVIIAILFAFFLTMPENAPAGITQPNRAQIDKAIAALKPALVRIRVVSTEYRDGREVKSQEVGSGAIITKDGYLVTNHHVAGHAARLFCTLWNREEIEADLVGTDPLTDISVLKLRPEKTRSFTPAAFGDSARMQVGDPVLAMGSPMALSQSVTLGILSNTEMVMPKFFGNRSRFRLDGEDVGALVRWFAHDAAIYGGNSGGPLVNLRGEIIGINEISFGLSGAIPGNLAKTIAQQIMQHHRVERSWLGIDAQPLFKQAQAEHGVLVSGVVEGSPADKAGLKSGDRLLKINQTVVNVHFEEEMPDFMWLASTLPLDKPVKVTAERDGREMEFSMTPIERGQIFLRQHELKQWGLVGRNYSLLLAKKMKRANTDGVLVTSVRPGGPAGDCKPALEEDDTLVQVTDTPIKNVADLIKITQDLTIGKTDPLPVIAVFERKAERYLTVVKIGIQDLKDPGLEVSKAWLPVEAHAISREIARQLGEPSLKGFYITRIYTGSTAEKAGLKPGDFIVAVDGEKLMASGAEYEDELSTLIRQYDIGKKVELAVLRGKQELKLNVELIRSPPLEREMKKYRNADFDFTARDISFFDTADEQWSTGQHGALVVEVRPGSWAELASLDSGDLILEIDGEAINNVDDLRHKLEQIAAAKKNVVVMKILRGIQNSYLELEPNWRS